MIFAHTKDVLIDPAVSANFKIIILLLDLYRSPYFQQGKERFKNISKDYISQHTGYSKNHVNKLLRFIAFSYEPEALHIRKNYLELKFIKNSVYDKIGNEKKGTCNSDLIEVSFIENKLFLYTDVSNSLPENFNSLEIEKYLAGSKYFNGLKPANLVNLTAAKTQQELLKALFYTDAMKKKINNPLGYLKTCFDAGVFKYAKDEPDLKKSNSIKKTIDENLVYKITKNDYQTLKNFKFDDYKVCCLHYDNFVLITSMTYHTKKANPKNLLTKLGLKYEAFER